MSFNSLIYSNKIYNPDDIEEVLSLVSLDTVKGANSKEELYNIPCSFDIETSSFYDMDNNKTAIMYIWMFGLDGAVIIGRKWDEFITMMSTISKYLELCPDNKRLVCYVHNLAYEFQFIKGLFNWKKVFAISSRKPIYAITNEGLEFRCSYLLSGYSLEKVGEHLQKYKISKKVGQLDYRLIRHNKTELTADELEYCVNDIKVVMAYIEEKIEQGENLSIIPMTKTGYVRNYCRKMCFEDDTGDKLKSKRKKSAYMYGYMKYLTLSPDDYLQVKRAFQGGFTHANPLYSGRVMHQIGSFDFTSSYPTVLVAEKFPMSSPEPVKIRGKQDFYKNLKYYCCMFDVEFIGLKSKITFDSYISRYHCSLIEKPVVNNGRVVSADKLVTTITEQDFKIIEKVYTWDDMKISNFKRFKKGYLPRDLVLAILTLYKDKTELKGVVGKEVEYLASKEKVNACFGMMVTDIVRDENTYSNIEGWATVVPDLIESLNKYNGAWSRFLYYPWGVWCTAYARFNLWSGILEYGLDYVYADTDSIKGMNSEKHIPYIIKYNEIITEKLRKACTVQGIPFEMTRPKTIKGVEKPLGVWDSENQKGKNYAYDRFKTLGAKRYMVEEDGDINITVSGVNKKKAVPYICEGWSYEVSTHKEINNPFDKFSNSLYIPKGFTGKNTHTYIDEKRQGIIEDYKGKRAEYTELSCVHMEEADYSLSISQEYIDYIMSLEEVSI